MIRKELADDKMLPHKPFLKIMRTPQEKLDHLKLQSNLAN